MNKRKHIVSKKHKTAKKDNRLENMVFLQKKKIWLYKKN